MKKKICILLICVIMIAANLCGCAAPAVSQPQAAQEAEPVKTPVPLQTPAPAEVEDTKSPTDWIVSDIMGSVTADMQLDPKDDFHAAINQDWLSTARIPQGYTNVLPAVERSIEVRDQMLALIKDTTQNSHEARLVRTLYDQYTDMDTRNALGIAPLLPYIEKIQALETIDDLRQYVAGNQDQPGGAFVSVGASTDYKDSTAYIVSINTSSFSLGDADEYRSITSLGERKKTANEAMLIDLLMYAGMTKEEAQQINDDFFALETRIAEVALGTQASLAPDYYETIYNPMTLEELETLSPNYPIADILEPYTAAGVERFNLPDREWFKRINALFVEENLAGLKAFLIRSAAMGMADFLDQTCMDIADARKSAINGIEIKTAVEDAAYKICASEESLLDMAAAKMYTDAYVSPETKAELEAMVQDVIAVYRRRLENNEWLTDETRANAVEKLDHLKVRVAYPDDWSVYDYSTLSFKSYEEGGSLIGNYIALGAYARAQDVKKALSPVDSRRWLAAPQMVNAAYSPNDNSINIFAGILGNAFYDADAPIETKLGTIGMVIGHEISHGFDDRGSQFDKDGNLVDWWTQEDKAAFEERTAKVSAYFSQFETLPGLFANGELEKGEAVADLGGVSCMLEIAKDIPDFDYALFFESYARMWRRSRPEEVVEAAVRTDPHPLNYLRTNITVQQFEEFYHAYGIKEGDGMYLAPEKRLAVW